jgi:hypothetical protein
MDKIDFRSLSPVVFNALRQYDLDALRSMLDENSPLSKELEDIVKPTNREMFSRVIKSFAKSHEDRSFRIKKLSDIVRSRNDEAMSFLENRKVPEQSLLNGKHWYPFPVTHEEADWIFEVTGYKYDSSDDATTSINYSGSVPANNNGSALPKKKKHNKKSKDRSDLDRLANEKAAKKKAEKLEAISKAKIEIASKMQKLKTRTPLVRARGIVKILKEYPDMAREIMGAKIADAAIKRVEQSDASVAARELKKTDTANKKILDRIRKTGSMTLKKIGRIEIEEERLQVFLEPALHPAIPRSEMRFGIGRILRGLKVSDPNLIDTPDGVRFSCSTKYAKAVYEFVKAKSGEIEAKKDDLLSPTSTEIALGINSRQRLEMIAQGIIPSAGTREIKASWGRGNFYHLHCPREIVQIIESGTVKNWLKQRKEQGVKKRISNPTAAAETRKINREITDQNNILSDKTNREEWERLLPDDPYPDLPLIKMKPGIRLNKREAKKHARYVINQIYGPLLKQRQREKIGIGDIRLLHLDAPPMPRKILALLGPTNSGKTHHGLEKLKEAKTGAYLAPLRLMALENHETLVRHGVSCSLVTGEEQRGEPEDTHVSSTIETFNINKHYDVILIDEIQLIADPDRGWAWSRALACASANLVVVAGSPDAEPLIRRIAELNNDDLEVRHFERRNALEVEQDIIGWDKIRKGDAIIAFTRDNVLDIKETANDHGYKSAVIYGALGPEARSEQARMFREGECDVLIATDAIGMGLNLPIDRVVFSVLEKYDGKTRRKLNPSEFRQIAGRAGRFSAQTPGKVAAMVQGYKLKSLMDGPSNIDPHAPLPVKPGWPLVERVMKSYQVSLEKALGIISKALSDHHAIRYTLDDDELLVLQATANSKMPAEDRFRYLGIPLNLNKREHFLRFKSWITNADKGRKNTCPELVSMTPGEAGSEALKELESNIQAVSAYLWLNHRFPEFYPEEAEAFRQRAEGTATITRILRQKRIKRSCQSCRTPLKSGSKHRICNSCYETRYFEDIY